MWCFVLKNDGYIATAADMYRIIIDKSKYSLLQKFPLGTDSNIQLVDSYNSISHYPYEMSYTKSKY